MSGFYRVIITKTNNYISNLNFTFVGGVGIFVLLIDSLERQAILESE